MAGVISATRIWGHSVALEIVSYGRVSIQFMLRAYIFGWMSIKYVMKLNTICFYFGKCVILF